jgi:hypothetical protein
MNKQYTQSQILTLIQTYNSTDRKQIKSNLKEIKKKYNFQNHDIVTRFGFSKEKTKCWSNMASINIPVFEDALLIATAYNFDIMELIEGVKED